MKKIQISYLSNSVEKSYGGKYFLNFSKLEYKNWMPKIII